MAVKEILLLGDPGLYTKCDEVGKNQLKEISDVITDLHDTLFDFRRKYNAGRAIAAPQINVMKRIVYMHIDHPVVFLNPELINKSGEMITLWDDCMSFPDLLVKVNRHRYCSVIYKDMNWNDCRMDLADDLSELLQHETDHLDGILAVQRALDNKSFKLKALKVRENESP